jgi:hypothetical protein
MVKRKSTPVPKAGATQNNVVPLRLVEDNPPGSETRELLSALFACRTRACRTRIRGMACVVFFDRKGVEKFATGLAKEDAALTIGHLAILQAALQRKSEAEDGDA